MPVIVRVRVAGAVRLMMPSGLSAVLTMPGSALSSELAMAESIWGCPWSTKPKIAKARARAGKIEKNAK